MKKFLKGCGLVVVVLVVGSFCVSVVGSVLLTNSSSDVPSSALPDEPKATQPVGDGNSQSDQVTNGEVQQDKPEDVSEPMIEDNAPAFDEFCRNSTMGGSTELQWDTFKEQVIGRRFVDRVGVVRDVREDLFGNYSLHIGSVESYGACSLDIWFNVDKDDALDIKKGQLILFGGEISSIAEILTVVDIKLDAGYFRIDSDAIAKTEAESVNAGPVPGKIGEPVECGDYFTVTVLDVPEFAQSMGYGNTAAGKYLVVKVEIVNNGDKTVNLNEDYFKVAGTLDGKELEFAADWDPSYYAARRNYGYAILSDDVPPGIAWKTQVAFDVNPNATNFIFKFLPRANYFASNALCSAWVSLEDTE